MCEVDLAAGLIVFKLVDDPINETGTGDPPNLPTSHIEYLLLQKKEEHRRHNWGPPKGYAKSGESDESTALRETLEETGLTEKDLSVLNEFEIVLQYNAWRRKKRVKYWPARLINPNNNSIVISEEHNEFRWLRITEAIELAFGSDMKQELKRCNDYLVNLYGMAN